MFLLLPLAMAQNIYVSDRSEFGVQKLTRPERVAQLTSRLRGTGRSIYLRTADGDQRLYPKGPGLRSLDRPALVAIGIALDYNLPHGTEHDLVLRGADGVLPVSVWPQKERITVAQGTELPLPAVGPTKEDLSRQHGLAPLQENGASFEGRVLGVIDASIGLLTPAERDLLTDVVLTRIGGDSAQTHGSVVQTARFDQRNDGNSILFWDGLVTATTTFIGSVDKPYHPAFHTVVHEMAHAIDYVPTSRATTRYNANVDAYNAKVKQHRKDERRLRKGQATEEEIRTFNARSSTIALEEASVRKQSEALEAREHVSAGFRKRFGAVTAYAKTSDEEAFAEAFTLFKLDPDALRRTSPEALTWFERGEHLRP